MKSRNYVRIAPPYPTGGWGGAIGSTIREYCPRCGFQQRRFDVLDPNVGWCCDGYMRPMAAPIDCAAPLDEETDDYRPVTQRDAEQYGA